MLFLEKRDRKERRGDSMVYDKKILANSRWKREIGPFRAVGGTSVNRVKSVWVLKQRNVGGLKGSVEV